MTASGARLRPSSPATRRAWLVLLLLVGLLGMHGLASDHASTAAAATPSQASLSAPAAAAAQDRMAGMPVSVAVHTLVPAGTRIDPPAAGTGMGMAGLCLAVLVLLLLTAVRQDRASRLRAPDLLLARLLARTRALPPPTPPDLVAGLCVSRT